MLQNKNAVIFAAGGSLGSAIAKAFAAAGATVFLSGRTIAPVQKVAAEILASDGKAYVAQVDAMDEAAVNGYVSKVMELTGAIDICFNLIDLQVVQNMPLADMTLGDFVRPSAIAMQSHFITDIAVARVMMKQASGVILSLTATPGGIGNGYAGWHRLSIYGRFCAGLRRHGEFFAQPGWGAGHLWHQGGEYPFRRLTRLKGFCGRHSCPS